ncbi:hypothetical protein ACOSP6_15630 [Tenacibaculum sp. MEBiC06402]|uniref:hypothetical protein n=1 Tax=unclassified Tenacibaculum TaxID=2635139 RepID=UPI003B9AA8D5
MSDNFKNKKFQELLDRLQQDSWQLELIISGFAIFGLFTALPEIKLSLSISENEKQIINFVISIVALIACYILIFNLLFHVTLRGLWIGALGLRYVSGDIDFETLNYHDRFKNFLKKKIVSFDKYVAILENYCSVLFAVSFLLIFYVISITIIIVVTISTIAFFIENESIPKTLRIVLGTVIIFTLVFGSFLVFIDFVTQGYLKKKKWLSKIYFPFYWIFSFITLSFLYRPLVYNFLDNKFTKRISFLLIPVYILITFISSVKYQTSNYLDKTKLNSNIYLSNKVYEDLLIKDEDLVKDASIQSKVITGPYINLFKVFSENVENRIYNYHPSLKPEQDNRGFSTGINFTSSGSYRMPSKKRDSLSRKYVEVVNEMYEIQIDSTKFDAEFLIGKNKKNQTGFQTFIPTKNLEDGKHTLKLKRKFIRKKDTFKKIDITIPFWYFKD